MDQKLANQCAAAMTSWLAEQGVEDIQFMTLLHGHSTIFTPSYDVEYGPEGDEGEPISTRMRDGLEAPWQGTKDKRPVRGNLFIPMDVFRTETLSTFVEWLQGQPGLGQGE